MQQLGDRVAGDRAEADIGDLGSAVIDLCLFGGNRLGDILRVIGYGNRIGLVLIGYKLTSPACIGKALGNTG